MDTDLYVQFGILGVLIVLSAFFSSAETALMSVNKIRIMNLAEDGNKKAMLVHQLLEDPHKLISTILVGNNIVNIGASAIATKVATDIWGNAGVGLATGLMTITVLIFGEVTPKSLAQVHANNWAMAIAKPIRLLCVLFSPAVKLLSIITKFMMKLSRKEGGEDPFITEDELKLLVSAGQEEGFLDENETEMINSIFEFDATSVREIMVPRMDMVAINGEESLKTAIELIVDAGHSRIPAYDQSIDNIIGLLYAKDVLKNMDKNLENMKVKDILRSAYYIPETKKVNDLLTELRTKRVHMAVILDEYGGTAGLVTIEDVIEEIVGDIQDEYDTEEELIIVNADGSMTVDARTTIDELNDALDSELPDDDYDTIGGLVFDNLGGIPLAGQEVNAHGLNILVAKTSGRRVSKVIITRIDENLENGEE